MASRRAHNPEVVGSNPAPATKIADRTAFSRPIFVKALACAARSAASKPTR